MTRLEAVRRLLAAAKKLAGPVDNLDSLLDQLLAQAAEQCEATTDAERKLYDREINETRSLIFREFGKVR